MNTVIQYLYEDLEQLDRLHNAGLISTGYHTEERARLNADIREAEAQHLTSYIKGGAVTCHPMA